MLKKKLNRPQKPSQFRRIFAQKPGRGIPLVRGVPGIPRIPASHNWLCSSDTISLQEEDMHTRREFISGIAGAAAWAAVPGKDEISLAAWSINRSFFLNHRWTNLELPKICRETFSIGALEFVNQFFGNPMMPYLNQLKKV